MLLAGDAAHATNPLGGMGFTTGIQDASDLVDSLVAVIDGSADERILDHYAEERRRIFLELASPTAIEHKRRLQEPDPAKRREDEEKFLRLAADPDKVREVMAFTFKLEGRPYVPK